jgi:hypothetical protein
VGSRLDITNRFRHRARPGSRSDAVAKDEVLTLDPIFGRTVRISYKVAPRQLRVGLRIELDIRPNFGKRLFELAST